RWGCEPPRSRRRPRERARSRPPGTRQLCAPRARDSFFRSLRRSVFGEGKVLPFLIAEFGHALEEICVKWGLSSLHSNKANAQHLRLLRALRAATVTTLVRSIRSGVAQQKYRRIRGSRNRQQSAWNHR